jgi:hypothetical protein
VPKSSLRSGVPLLVCHVSRCNPFYSIRRFSGTQETTNDTKTQQIEIELKPSDNRNCDCSFNSGVERFHGSSEHAVSSRQCILCSVGR